MLSVFCQLTPIGSVALVRIRTCWPRCRLCGAGSCLPPALLTLLLGLWRDIGEIGQGPDEAVSGSCLAKRLYKAISSNAYKDGFGNALQLSRVAVKHFDMVPPFYLSLDAGAYSLAMQLVNAVANFASVCVNSAHPSLQAAFAAGDEVRERRLVAKSSAIYLVLFFICGAGVCLVVMPFVILIKPSYSLPMPLLVLLLVHYLFWKQSTNFAAFISNRNEVPYVKAFIVSSVVGTALSAMLCVVGFGPWGLIAGQMVSQMVFTTGIGFLCVPMVRYRLLLASSRRLQTATKIASKKDEELTFDT